MRTMVSTCPLQIAASNTNSTKQSWHRSRAMLTVLIGAAVCSLALTGPVHAFAVCAKTCPVGDVACVASVAACETKINAYNIYMAQMGADVPKLQLPSVYRDVLGPKYSQANFNSYRFGFSDRQPPHNATTDCATTYFNSVDYVDGLKNADANPDWHWLLHEVTHVEQCTAAGGREAYAKRWWGEMEARLAAMGRTVDFTQTPDQLAKQMGGLFLMVHDAMPMERAADNKAASVLVELERCCIDQGRKPIRPLKVTAIDDHPDAGSTVRLILTAKVDDGDSPFTSKWRIKSPGDLNYVNQPQNLVNGLALLWTPKKDPARATVETEDNAFYTKTTRRWTFDIEVEVLQQATSLDTQKLTRTIVITEGSTIPKKSDTGPVIPQIPKESPQPVNPGLPSPGQVPPLPPAPSPNPSPDPVPPKPPLPSGP